VASSDPAVGNRPTRKRSLLELLTDVPVIVRELVTGEIEVLKQEMIRKLRALGVGAGLIGVAFIILLGMLGVLLTAAVLALSLIMPGWLAALLVAAALLVIAVIIGLIGYRVLKKGIPPLPSETIAGLKKDLNVIKGVGKRTDSRE
jgi:tetrahydromethanopterin S-methyltransferase subunit C